MTSLKDLQVGIPSEILFLQKEPLILEVPEEIEGPLLPGELDTLCVFGGQKEREEERRLVCSDAGECLVFCGILVMFLSLLLCRYPEQNMIKGL